MSCIFELKGEKARKGKAYTVYLPIFTPQNDLPSQLVGLLSHTRERMISFSRRLPSQHKVETGMKFEMEALKVVANLKPELRL